MIQKAVIVAAGCSSRLRPYTENTPKGLLPLGHESILGRSVRLLREAGIQEICLVVGYLKEQMYKAFEKQNITFISNPFYKETNNMGSLWFAKDWVGEESFIYLHSDIAYDPQILSDLLKRQTQGSGIMVYDPQSNDAEAMKVRMNGNFLVESSKEIPLAESRGEWIGMTKFEKQVNAGLFQTIEDLLFERQFQVYDTAAFNRMIQNKVQFEMMSTQNKPWIEIDFPQDYERAQKLFGCSCFNK